MSFSTYINRHQRSGSAILAVVLFVLFAVTVLATLMPSMITEYKSNIRNRLLTVAVGVSEYGCRQAVWGLNNYETDEEWTNGGWTISTEDDGDTIALKEYAIAQNGDSTYTLDDGETARVRIIMRNVSLMNVEIISESTVYRNDMEVKQMVTMRISKTTPFMGLIAKDSLTFNGQPSFNSFNSNVFPYTYTYGVNTGQSVTVGSISTSSGSVDLGNGHVYGNVVSGASDPIDSGAVSGGKTITGAIVGDFYMDFPDVETPDTSGWATSF